MKKLLSILCFLIYVITPNYSQETRDFTSEIKKYDYSSIFISDSVMIEEGPERIAHPEFYGFFGQDYQRFQIHFISVIKNNSNPLVYLVYGKTMLKNNICDFQGSLNITKAELFNGSDAPGFKQGFIEGTYVFFEDSKQKGSGKLQGEFSSNFIIDKNNHILYDALSIVADGYSNNEFAGTWSKYGSENKIVCNWGEFRIPESGDLDVGTGEFMIDKKYSDKGWETFRKANDYYPDPIPEDVKKARAIENRKWWKE